MAPSTKLSRTKIESITQLKHAELVSRLNEVAGIRLFTAQVGAPYGPLWSCPQLRVWDLPSETAKTGYALITMRDDGTFRSHRVTWEIDLMAVTYKRSIIAQFNRHLNQLIDDVKQIDFLDWYY